MPALVDSMFSVREVPWHGKGEIVDHALTAAEAIQAAGLDWTVEPFPVAVNGKEVPDYQAIVRMDRGEVLGIMGSRYHPVQNADLFSFFDGVVEREEGAFYHTGGSLRGGRRVWLLAKVPGDFYVPGVEDDKVDNYILLASSHDGSLCVVAKHTPIRVVCNNTLAAALRYQAQRQVTVRHTSTAKARLAEASQILGLAQKRAEAMQEAAAAMLAIPVTEGLMLDLFQRVFPSSLEKDGQPPSTKVQNVRDTVRELFESGSANNLPGMAGTGWALYNAVGEFVDHVMPARTVATDTLDRTWFGQSAARKAKAAAVLLGKVK